MSTVVNFSDFDWIQILSIKIDYFDVKIQMDFFISVNVKHYFYAFREKKDCVWWIRTVLIEMTKQALNPELLDGKPTIAPVCHHHHQRSQFLKLEYGGFNLLFYLIISRLQPHIVLRRSFKLVRHCGAMDTNWTEKYCSDRCLCSLSDKNVMLLAWKRFWRTTTSCNKKPIF